MTTLLNELVELWWEMCTLSKADDHEFFVSKAKPLLKKFIEKARGGGQL